MGECKLLHLIVNVDYLHTKIYKQMYHSRKGLIMGYAWSVKCRQIDIWTLSHCPIMHHEIEAGGACHRDRILDDYLLSV